MADFQASYPGFNGTTGSTGAQNQSYGQLSPQGLFGGLLGGPVGGLIGRGIGGLFGNPSLGGQIGQIAGGIGGSLLPFSADPMAAYAQQLQQAQLAQQLQQAQLAQQLQQVQQAQLAQQRPAQSQLAPQGWIGDLIGHVAQPVGGRDWRIAWQCRPGKLDWGHRRSNRRAAAFQR